MIDREMPGKAANERPDRSPKSESRRCACQFAPD